MTANDKIAKTTVYGDFQVQLQYVGDDPCMVVSAARFRESRRSAWVIPIDAAWKYVDDVEAPGSGHSEYMVEASTKIADMLGLGSDVKTRFRVAEGIVNNLEELINMPPGNFKKEVVASGTASINGGEEFDFEMFDERGLTH